MAIGFVLSLLLAYLVRNNYIILAMSFAIVALLDFLRKKDWTYLAMVGVAFVSFSLSNHAITCHYEELSGQDLSGIPKIAWVTMGLNDTPMYGRIAGWYDAYVENVYTETEGDFAAIEQESKQDLSDRLTTFITNPRYTLRFFRNKILSTWTDSLFQSIWSGPMKTDGQEVEGTLTKSIYREDGKLRPMLYFFAHVILVLIYLGVFAALAFGRQFPTSEQTFLLLPTIYLSGGFLFHLFWETKSQYVYPYMVLLLPLAAYGLVQLVDFLKNKAGKKNFERIRKAE